MAKKKNMKKKQKGKVREFMINVSQMQSDIKTFIEKFKSDVAKKRKSYQSSARKFQKKK